MKRLMVLGFGALLVLGSNGISPNIVFGLEMPKRCEALPEDTKCFKACDKLTPVIAAERALEAGLTDKSVARPKNWDRLVGTAERCAVREERQNARKQAASIKKMLKLKVLKNLDFFTTLQPSTDLFRVD